MHRLIMTVLLTAPVAGLVLAPAAVAGQPPSAELTPPPPSFYTCMVTGRQTICHANRVTIEDPVDTEIVCGDGAAAFDIFDQGTIHQRATRYYDADGNLTRRVNHENWAPAWWSNPQTGAIVPYTQSSTTTTALKTPGDFSSATETVVGENVYRDPTTGQKLLMSVGRQVVNDADGTVEFRSGKQPFLDAFVDGDMSVFDGVCAALAR